MNAGSVAEWVTITGLSLAFICSLVAAWAVIRKDVQSNSAEIKLLQGQIDAIKEREIAIETIAACLDKTIQSDLKIDKVAALSVTIPMHEKMQADCQANVKASILAVSRENENLISNIKEIKSAMEKQSETMSAMLVAVAQLTTKIDERTGGSRLDRVSTGQGG